MTQERRSIAWLQAGPMMLGVRAVLPVAACPRDHRQRLGLQRIRDDPGLSLRGYTDTFEGCIAELPNLCTILKTYLKTVKLCFLTWALTLLIGFTVAYFLAFHVRSKTWQIVLSLLCTIPFWTSNVIRMIAWIPLLGRNGLVNRGLEGVGLISAAAGVAAVLGILRGAGAGASVHLLHGGADLQLHDPHRQAADRSRL